MLCEMTIVLSIFDYPDQPCLIDHSSSSLEPFRLDKLWWHASLQLNTTRVRNQGKPERSEHHCCLTTHSSSLERLHVFLTCFRSPRYQDPNWRAADLTTSYDFALAPLYRGPSSE